MKKASKILFLIGGILAIFAVLIYLIFGIGSLVCYGLGTQILNGVNPGEEIVKAFNDLCAQLQVTMEQVVPTFLTMGIVFMILFVLNIASVVISFVCKAKEKSGLGLLIPSAAINLCASNLVSLVGAVLGIVYWATKGRKADLEEEDE